MRQIKKYFGTDGIRGSVGVAPITADFMLKLGWAIGTALAAKGGKSVIIGKDTRISGYMIESALQAGLSASGVKILLLGPMPTAGIGYLMLELGADMGIVISASHNSFEDNGIKLFSSDGFKSTGLIEKDIEAILAQPMTTNNAKMLGKARRVDEGVLRYIDYCKSLLPSGLLINPFKIALDCANGATYHIAPRVFSKFCTDLYSIHTVPDGFNINVRCGTNCPETIRNTVLNIRADIGIAFDGDGDRVILVDHRGEILDGDEILYVITKGLIAAGTFTGGVVGTSMSNAGLELALNQLGVLFKRVSVGENNVVQALRDSNWKLGGEPSGHAVYLPMSKTGDGIITALLVLQAMDFMGKNLYELKQGMKKFPQRTANIPYDGEKFNFSHHDVVSLIHDAEKKLGQSGRVLLRNSGTEPLIRVMVEGQHRQTVDSVIEELSMEIERQIRGK